MKAYPEELRIRIVRAVEGGMAQTEAARVFAVSERTVRRYLTTHRAGGDLTPGQSPGRPPTIGPAEAAALQAQVAAHPDATLADHCDRWSQEQGETVSMATMSRAIRGHAITVKKSPLRGRTR
jgi:transposase